ncbi:MAG: M56 family metallopeptidase [Acetatifactor sp.]
MTKNLTFFLTAVYWFNSFVWIAFLLQERDMEMSCDEKVIKRMGSDIRKQYSPSLLNFAEGRGI